ncbi:FecR family protein [Pedobacter frigoris]|uniref:DUF4974 domain-containing protein n=1 Tax=Pedobacter frigoris TaxID=2571272 RepID=A0A4U1CHJ7_9SPHI|nr:FecR family protein [Pedobacter frigoris]TKC06067.1 DUF4974 domain-containing protein [Pedobacter frigoris]
MNDNKLKILIEKYLADTATKAERFIVESWLESFQLDSDDISQLEARDNSQKLAQRIIDRVNNPKTEPYHIPLWKKLGGIAAGITAFSILALFLLKPFPPKNEAISTLYSEYRTGVNEFKELRLPDSTLVYLNANSTLSVQKSFIKHNERRVKLDGEAFFEVRKDKKHPFKIQVGELQVKVLGTSFNIQGHKSINEIRVAVKSGKVQVNNGVPLIANQLLVYNKRGKTFQTLIREAIPEALWRKGISVLDRASFDELVTVMFNVYGVNLTTTSKRVINERYNFTIRSSRTLKQSLNQFCELTKKKYRKEGNTIVIY